MDTVTDDRDCAKVWNEKGMGYAKLENWEVAKRYLEKCVEADPDNGEYWYHLGLIFRNMGKATEAIPHYEKAISCQPNNGRFWSGLGLACWEAGYPEKELHAYEEGLKVAPEDPELWYNKGGLLMKSERFIEARYCFEKSIAYDPTDRFAMENLRHCTENIEQIAILGIVDRDPSGNVRGAVMYWNMDVDDLIQRRKGE